MYIRVRILRFCEVKKSSHQEIYLMQRLFTFLIAFMPVFCAEAQDNTVLFIEEVEVLAGTSSYDHRPFEVVLKQNQRTRRVRLVEDEDVTIMARIKLSRRRIAATDNSGEQVILKVKYICDWRSRFRRVRQKYRLEIGKPFVIEQRFLYDRGYLNGKVILNSAWRIKR